MHLFYHQSIRVAYGNFIYNGIVSNDMQLYICALIIRYHMNGGHEFQKRNETAEKNMHTHTHMLGRRCWWWKVNLLASQNVTQKENAQGNSKRQFNHQQRVDAWTNQFWCAAWESIFTVLFILILILIWFFFFHFIFINLKNALFMTHNHRNGVLFFFFFFEIQTITFNHRPFFSETSFFTTLFARTFTVCLWCN